MKKIFSYIGLAIVIFAVAIPATPLAADSVTSGDLIKGSGSAVYYYGVNGKRYLFPNQAVYSSWYDSTFTGVITLTDAELVAIPFGGNVTVRPGKLVQVVSMDTPWQVMDPRVYAVSKGGELHWVKTAAAASAIFGMAWEDQIVAVPESLLTDYTIGSEINFASDYSLATEQAVTTINHDRNLIVTKPDVLLLSMSNLDKDNNFFIKIREFIDTLDRTENLKAAYLELDSEHVKDTYGAKVTDKTNWLNIKNVLKTIIEKENPTYLIILGGPDVVPRPEIAGVRCADSSNPVRSDSWYIDLNGDQIPDDGLSIARIADYEASSLAILKYLDTAIKVHNAGGFTASRYAEFLGFCAEGKKGCYLSPPHCVDRLGECGCSKRSDMLSILSSSDYIVLAGHGTEQGFYTDLYYTPISCLVFDVVALDEVNLNIYNPVVIGYYSCYSGGLGIGQTKTWAVEFPKAGASIFVGRTETLGAPPTVGTDFRTNLENGIRVGDALFQEVRESSLIDCKYIDEANALVLYGDPTLHIRR